MLTSSPPPRALVSGFVSGIVSGSVLVALSWTSSGCGLVVSGEELGDDGGTAADLAEYEALAERLADDREQALDAEARAVTTSAPWLTWIELDPVSQAELLGLRRYPDRFELRLPAGERARVGVERVVTASVGPGGLELHGYALPEGELLAEQTLAELSEAPDALALAPATPTLPASAWILADGAVWSWALGPEPIVARGQLADAGVGPGSPTAVEIRVTGSGSQRLLIASGGQLWQLDPETWTAEALAELDALLDLDARGFLYTRGPGLYLHEFDGPTRRIDEAIVASGYSLNPTFASIHEYIGEGATLAADRVVYVTSAGLFAYDLDLSGPEAIAPVLLEPRWDVAAGVARIEYREPQVSGASVFARGLLGEAGEVGTEGPVFSVPLDP